MAGYRFASNAGRRPGPSRRPTHSAAIVPDSFRLDLAMSLEQQSVRSAGLGPWEEALVAITESVEIRRELASATARSSARVGSVAAGPGLAPRVSTATLPREISRSIMAAAMTANGGVRAPNTLMILL